MALGFRMSAGARFAADSRGGSIFRATDAVHKLERSQTNLENFRAHRSQSLLRRHIFVAIASAVLGVAGMGSSAHAQMKEVTFYRRQQPVQYPRLRRG